MVLIQKDFITIKPEVEQLISKSGGIIFDMDGTLIDMEKGNYSIYSEILREMYGIDITKGEWCRFLSGRRPQDSLPEFLKIKGITGRFNFERFKLIAGPLKENMLKNRIGETVRLTPGAEMFLRDLKMRNKKLALASSTILRFVSLMLSHFKLETLFDVVLTAESIKKGKPDPEIYLKALDQIKLPAANCLVFEDSDAGVEAALAAKIICIRVRHYDNGFSK